MAIATTKDAIGRFTRDFARNRWSYIRYLAAIFRPGHPPPVIEAVDRTQVRDLANWVDADVDLLLDEGRRAADSGTASLAEIRARAQVAFTTCLVLFGALAAQLKPVRGHHTDPLRWILFDGSAWFTFLALGGSLAIIVIQLTVPVIHPALLTSYSSPVKRELARDYANTAVDWNRVNGTTRAVLREALLYLTLGGLLDAVVWILLH
jgi:hypothetical protein